MNFSTIGSATFVTCESWNNLTVNESFADFSMKCFGTNTNMARTQVTNTIIKLRMNISWLLRTTKTLFVLLSR